MAKQKAFLGCTRQTVFNTVCYCKHCLWPREGAPSLLLHMWIYGCVDVEKILTSNSNFSKKKAHLKWVLKQHFKAGCQWCQRRENVTHFHYSIALNTCWYSYINHWMTLVLNHLLVITKIFSKHAWGISVTFRNLCPTLPISLFAFLKPSWESVTLMLKGQQDKIAFTSFLHYSRLFVQWKYGCRREI